MLSEATGYSEKCLTISCVPDDVLQNETHISIFALSPVKEEVDVQLEKVVQQEQTSSRKHALVIGASMAGLLAARVLSDYFEQVTVIERDQLPQTAQARKGVPQGKHTHLFLNKGVEIVEELFPDLYPALEADGAVPIDAINDFHWFHYGVWKLQFAGPMRIYGQSRPLLESHVRRRVAARPNVRIFDSSEVLEFVGNADNRAGITGIRLRQRNQDGSEHYVPTNLVVDASGRGSQTPRWLTELGYPPVEEVQVKIGVGYASRLYRRSDIASNAKVIGIYPWPQEKKRIGILFPIENNACFVTLCGYLHDHPPADDAGFLAFARDLPQPDLYEAIKNAQPLGPVAIHKFPSDRRRYYERLHMPDGLIVLGDANCSFDPIYGQGMTAAALGAQTLRDCLQQQSRAETMKNFSSRFQKALAKVIDVPWMLATSEDFRYPEVEGKRAFGLGILQNYTKQVGRLSMINPFITQTFYEVMHMRKPPSALFHPRILLPALLARQPVDISVR